MTNIPKKFGPPLGPGEDLPQEKMHGRSNKLKWSLRLAEITRIDYENMVCDITYIQGESPPAKEVPISSAYWSKRGFLGAMPEVGSICIVGFTAAHKDSTRPLILSFLPNGYKTALKFDPSGPAPRDAEGLDVPTEVAQTEMEGLYGVDRRKFRKIYPGTIYGASTEGSEIILDRGIQLFDQSGGEFKLRGIDSSGILTTQDFYQTTSAGRYRSGRVIRNKLNIPSDFLNDDGKLPSDHPLFDEFVDAGIIFEDGSPVNDINGLPSTVLPDGRKMSPITENLNDPDKLGTQMYTENRLEIQEFSDGKMPFSDAHGFDADVIAPDQHYEPFIESVTGTVIGNNPYTSKGRTKYGKILKPVVFSSPSDTSGQPRLERIKNKSSETEKSLAAANLYRMNRPDGLGELFLSHDKEGHVFVSVPASTSKKSNLGAGRSIEADIKGLSKVTMGGDKNDNVSFDLRTKGGLKWTLGSVASTKRSVDVTAGGGVALDIQGSDLEGDSFKMTAEGNIAMAADGTYGISTTGDSLEDVGGKKKISAESMGVKVGTGDYTLNVLSAYDANIQGSHDTKIGKGRKTTIVAQGDKTRIVQGSSKVTMLAPAQRNIRFAAAGTHKIESGGGLTLTRQSGAAASYSFQAPSGSYSVTLGGGSITLSAGSGSINISPAGVNISGSNIGLSGTVGLGAGTGAPNAVVGGVPGPSPHVDYITGRPLRGNPQVRTT